MTDPQSYLLSKIEKRESRKGGYGLFAKEKIVKGEVAVDFSQGPGRRISVQEMDRLYHDGYDYGIQVGDGEFFAATEDAELEAVDFLNHSCDPNCGIKDSLKIVAMLDIAPDEEITFDYAMSESSDFAMQCACGSAKCRGVITGEDWKQRDLQERYKGYFSVYLEKKIEQAQ